MSATPPPAVSLDGVWVQLGQHDVLRDVCLQVEAHELLAIIGPNGGGKTTLLKVILGLLQPHRGAVRVFGEAPSRLRTRIGYVPQIAELDRDFPLDVRDVVMTGRLARRGLLRRYGRADREVVDQVIERVGLTELRRRQIGQLSGGQWQRMLVARALATDPEILLLDEPTSSLDSSAGESVYELLHQLSAERTVILVTHDIGVISHRIKRVACVNRELVVHDPGELSGEVFEHLYGCPVDLIAHGHPHRVFRTH